MCDFVHRRKSLADWYSPLNVSSTWTKQTLQFVAPVFLDTSYNGELLALSHAPYLQGIDERYDGDTYVADCTAFNGFKFTQFALVT